MSSLLSSILNAVSWNDAGNVHEVATLTSDVSLWLQLAYLLALAMVFALPLIVLCLPAPDSRRDPKTAEEDVLPIADQIALNPSALKGPDSQPRTLPLPRALPAGSVRKPIRLRRPLLHPALAAVLRLFSGRAGAMSAAK